MIYSYFTAKELVQKFGIKFKAKKLFENITLIEPSNWLNETLKRAKALWVLEAKNLVLKD